MAQYQKRTSAATTTLPYFSSFPFSSGKSARAQGYHRCSLTTMKQQNFQSAETAGLTTQAKLNVPPSDKAAVNSGEGKKK